MSYSELDSYILKLYTEEKYTLRQISHIINRDHHFIKRRLDIYGVQISKKDRRNKHLTQEHKKKISNTSKGRRGFWKDKRMPKESLYKNMQKHLEFKVDLDFLKKFDDIEKLKCLNKLLTRNRVKIHFDVEKYKEFIIKFYNDTEFNKRFDIFSKTKNKWDRPSIDHIIPLSKGGTWDLNNLQIISWFENRAKCDLTNEEFKSLIERYLVV